MDWWAILLVILGVASLAVAFAFWGLFGYRRKVRVKLPLRDVDGIPVLIQNGLPYPSGFAFTGNPKTDLNGEWLFGIGNILLDRGIFLKKVHVPVSFNTFGSEYQDYRGTFSYVKRFYADVAPDRLYRLCFKGVGGRCGVYLNGQKLCGNTDSYQPFYCDATGALKTGENTLIVTGDNTPSETTLPPKQFEGHKPGWHLYAGITRSVELEALPLRYCVNLRVSAGEHAISGGVVYAGNPGGCTIRLLDGERILAETRLVLHESDGFSAAEFAFEQPDNIETWTQKTPKLYMLEAKTDEETVRVSTGFRKWSRGQERIFLNGEPFTVRGVCLHEEDIALGASLTKQAAARNLDLARSLGCNFVRMAHYPHADEAFDYCDENGLCCWCEIPNYQAGLGLVQMLFGKSEQRKKRFSLRAVRKGVLRTRQMLNETYLTDAGTQLAKMVIRNQNRPCVAFWGVGNECFSYTPASRNALRFLRDTVRLIDPERFVGYAAFTAPPITLRLEKSFRVFDFVCANEYYGWYYGEMDDCAAFWSALAKKYHKPMLCTETGSDAKRGAQGVDLPGRGANSEAYQTRLLSRHIRLCEEIPGYCGTCIWALKDFLCEEYGVGDLVPYFNAKGLVSSDYRKKEAFDAVAGLYRRGEDR